MRPAAIMTLPIADIAIGNRVGFYHPDHAAALAEAMGADGQTDPIHVRANHHRAKQPWLLVAGRHRLGAAEQLGWAEIGAIQVADADARPDELLKLELSENLDHRQPRPIERSIFIASRARLEESLDHPGKLGERSQDRAIRTRWERAKRKDQESETLDENTSATMADVSGWRARTCSAMGCSPRSLERYLALHRAVVEPFPRELVEQLNGHPVGEGLAGMMRLVTIRTVSARLRTIEYIVAHPDLISVDAARVAVELSTSKGGAQSPCISDKYVRRMWSNWDRLDLGSKREFACELVHRLTPGIRADLLRALHDAEADSAR